MHPQNMQTDHIAAMEQRLAESDLMILVMKQRIAEEVRELALRRGPVENLVADLERVKID